MDVVALLKDLYGRVPPLAVAAVDGLSAAQLTWAPSPGSNSVGWLIWHLTRVQDHHIAEVLESDQLWAGGDWATRCGLEPDPTNTGYGHTADQVRSVRPDGPEVLMDYLRAVDARTSVFLEDLSAAELDRVVDRRWTPPVTLGVRLVSVADDCLQHVGQAAYVRGLLDRAD
jgi:DinB family protein